MEQSSDEAAEVRQLKACISDLLGIFALRSLWAGAGTERMARMLADVLLHAITADFVSIDLQEDNETPARASRFSSALADSDPTDEVRELFQPLLTSPAPAGLKLLTVEHGGAALSLAGAGIGLKAEHGFVITGSSRPDFPLPTERLIIQATINQAQICLQEAARLAEQSRRAAELDHLVAQRTAELASTNEQLVRQILERQALQDKLAHANRVATIGQMTAAFSHELRQPLASIVASGNAALNWLGQDPADVAAAQRSLNRLIGEGVRAGEIIDRTRRLMQNAPPKREAIDLNKTIVEVVDLLSSNAKARSAALHVVLDDNLPAMQADTVQIQQLVINLLSNALDAVSTLDVSSRRVQISTRFETPDSICVSVIDSGPGLQVDQPESLFQSFVTTKETGLGLGLAICRNIVEGHSGRIWAENSDNGGAAFHFTLPVAS